MMSALRLLVESRLQTLQQGNRAYLLLDGSVLNRKQRKLFSLLPLFADTGLSSVIEDGPQWLDVDTLSDTRWAVLEALLSNFPQSLQLVLSKHELSDLNAHYQRQLDGFDVGNKQLIWFHFYQATVLPILHRELPDEYRAVLFGPVAEWWVLDRGNEWQKLTGDNAGMVMNPYRHPFHGEVFPLSAELAQALNDERLTDDVYQWLRHHLPDTLPKIQWHALARIQEMVEYARAAYALTDINAILSWCILAMLTVEDVDQKIPEIAQRMHEAGSGEGVPVNWLTYGLSDPAKVKLEEFFQARKQALM